MGPPSEGAVSRSASTPEDYGRPPVALDETSAPPVWDVEVRMYIGSLTARGPGDAIRAYRVHG